MTWITLRPPLGSPGRRSWRLRQKKVSYQVAKSDADRIADVEVVTEDSSLEEGIYAPVQSILDQVRAIKGPST